MKILASIITYNPDLPRLEENILSIYKQVNNVLIIDNASKNVSDIEQLVEKYSCFFIKKNKNIGVASALNNVFLYAKENLFDWVLTLDQDSIAENNLISYYKKYVNLDNIGILTCEIKDRNITYFEKNKVNIERIKWCITSGSFCSVKAYIDCGGFDDWMFIDSVDLEYCLNLTMHHYNIMRINYIGLLHEVGKSKLIKILGKNIIIYNENAMRNYYMARNLMYLSYKYPKYITRRKVWLLEFKSLLLILLFEKKKISKIKNRIRGLKDGMSVGKTLL